MLTFGTGETAIQLDPTSLPPTSLDALLSRGFSHFLGNEQASKVTARIRKAIVEARVAALGESPAEDAVKAAKVDPTADQVNQFREENQEQVTGWTAEARNTAVEALKSGTVGVRVGGTSPRASTDPLAAEMTRIAKVRVNAKLQGAGIKFPKGKDSTVEIAGQAMTMADLIGRQLNPEGSTYAGIKSEAEKNLKAQAKLKAQAAETDGKSLEDLGL